MKKFLPLIMFIILPYLVFAQDSNTNTVSLLIMPLQNLTPKEDSAGSDNYRILFFGPIHNFIQIIPGVTLPDRDKLLSMNFDSSNVATFAALNPADFIIYGDYTLKGKTKKDQKLSINLYVWSQKLGAVFFQKAYTSGTEFEVLDAIDNMLEDIIAQTLQKRLAVATLQFSGFRIGNEKYGLYINEKYISDVSGDGFSMNLKVLADQNYQITLRNLSTAAVAFDQTFVPKKGEAITIGYYAVGVINIPTVPNKKSKSIYDLYLIHASETNIVSDNTVLSNIYAGRDYTFWLIEDKTNFVYTNTFTLHDKETVLLKPSLKGLGGFSMRLNLNDGLMLVAYGDYFWNNWFYTGLMLGASPVPLLGDWGNAFPGQTFMLSVAAGIDIGAYILGNRGTEGFRLAAGISARYYLSIIAPELLNISQVFSPQRSFVVGPHVMLEYDFLMFSAGFYFAPLANFETYQFPVTLSLGVRFHF